MSNILRGDRLSLREWSDDDYGPFAELNADPLVAEHLPSPLTRRQSDDFADRIRAHFREHGYGLWAVEIRGVTPFAGFVGLSIPTFGAHFTPCVEVGWRLARAHWGQGFATEGARLALELGFAELGLSEIVSFTVPSNRASIRVMEKIGMKYRGAFDHPKLPVGHPLRPHVLYTIGLPLLA